MSLESDAQVLARLAIFQHLEREAVRLLAFHAELCEYISGDQIFEFGQKADGGLVVINGSVSLTAPDGNNKASRTVKVGGLIGQLALITDVTHRANAKALEPTSILKIQRSSFQRVLREYPGSAAKIRAAIASDLLDFTSTLEKSRAS